jgi:hypothetical protein
MNPRRPPGEARGNGIAALREGEFQIVDNPASAGGTGLLDVNNAGSVLGNYSNHHSFLFVPH